MQPNRQTVDTPYEISDAIHRTTVETQYATHIDWQLVICKERDATHRTPIISDGNLFVKSQKCKLFVF